MKSNHRLLLWVFVALACLLLGPSLVYGVRGSHDIKFHLTLFLSHRDAVELGTLYPRWLPDQMHGLGSPALLIYPPMASTFFVLIDVLSLHALAPERVLGLGALLLSIASGLTFYRWARNHVGVRPAGIAALFYATAPYHLNLDLYERGAMAEYTAFVWIPLIFLGIRTTVLAGHARGAALLAFSTSALFLTHLLTAMLVAPLALAYALVCLCTELPPGLRLRRFMLMALTAILGVGLAAFYYLPAVSLLPEANSGALHSDVAGTNIFLVLGMLAERAATSNIFSVLRTLPDRFGLKLLLLACAYLLFFLYLSAETWNNWRKQRMPGAATALALMWIVSGILCFALMSGLFPFIFRPPSPYAQIQFVWRLLAVMEFSLVSLFVCSLAGLRHAASRARLLRLGAAVALVLSASQCVDVIGRFHNVDAFVNPLHEIEQVKLRLSPLEYFPAGTKLKQRVDLAIQPFERYARSSEAAFISSEKGKLVSATRKGAQFTVHSIATEPTAILIQQFYFLGWKAFDEHGAEIAVFRDETSRLVGYVAPAGEHTVVVERLPTKQESWGKVISLVALVLLVLEVGLLSRRQAGPYPR